MRNSEAFQVLFGRAWTSFRQCLCGPAQVQQWARQIQGSWRSRRILSQGFLIRNQQENLLIVQICLVWHYWAKAMLLNAAVYNFSSKAPNFTGQSLAFLFALCCTVCSAAKVWASPEYHSCSCKRWQWDTFWIVKFLKAFWNAFFAGGSIPGTGRCKTEALPQCTGRYCIHCIWHGAHVQLPLAWGSMQAHPRACSLFRQLKLLHFFIHWVILQPTAETQSEHSKANS